jgi:hypothetical protein
VLQHIDTEHRVHASIGQSIDERRITNVALHEFESFEARSRLLDQVGVDIDTNVPGPSGEMLVEPSVTHADLDNRFADIRGEGLRKPAVVVAGISH